MACPTQIRGDRKVLEIAAFFKIAPDGEGQSAQSDLMERCKSATMDPKAERWSPLVGRIRANDRSAEEELYSLFQKGIRLYFLRVLGPWDIDDRIHDTFLLTIQALRKGDLREPEKLVGFVRTIARRQIARSIRRAVSMRAKQETGIPISTISDRSRNPEQLAIFRQQVKLANQFVWELCARDREILVRFYIVEQTQAQICREMTITSTQFRLAKSRAKARVAEISRKKLIGRRLRVASLATRF